jgi:hypothetical protein
MGTSALLDIIIEEAEAAEHFEKLRRVKEFDDLTAAGFKFSLLTECWEERE